MSYFSQSKGTRDMKPANEPESKFNAVPAPAKPQQETLSTFGPGMLITGNVVCTGALQILGRVSGEIHAAKLVVSEGAKVEGKVTAQEAVIQGAFNGTIHANNVRLESRAVVDAEIFNKTLTIEQNAQFEGVARRLEKQVEPPTAEEVDVSRPKASAEVVSISEAADSRA